MDHTRYQSPLSTRYAGKEMLYNWSDEKRISTWRKLWLYLARAERELGVEAVTEEAISQIEKNIANIDFEFSREQEKKLRHDVMAHLYTLGELAPAAKPILHLGATSCYVTDNSELILIRDSFDILLPKFARTCFKLSEFCKKYDNLPTLGYTHFQAAQLTTVGKRACLWLQDLISDIKTFERIRDTLKFRSVKGTTGTQASFLQIFNHNPNKVLELEKLINKYAGFEKSYGVTGQTYPRKTDVEILHALGSFSVSAQKIATDLRLLAHLKEVEEPFESMQIGSSAMPYKRNPMLSERVCSLSRHVIGLSVDICMTASTQWLERTLDDSAIRRIAISEAFLTVDAVINTLDSMFNNLIVYPKSISARIAHELPFMATENILMRMTEVGGDRQECHEAIRKHSLCASDRIKNGDGKNDLIERICNDEYFKAIKNEIPSMLDPHKFIGCAKMQVENFIKNEVEPSIAPYMQFIDKMEDSRVEV